MPQREEKQGKQLAKISVVEEFEAFVDVFCGEVIGVAVETIDVVLETRGTLEAKQLDVVACVPARAAWCARFFLLFSSVVRQTELDARCCNITSVPLC